MTLGGRAYERQTMMQKRPPQYCYKKPIHSERTNINTISVEGYRVVFLTGLRNLNTPDANYIQGIILEPEFGRYTRQMIELERISRKDPVTMSNVYETIYCFGLEELKVPANTYYKGGNKNGTGPSMTHSLTQCQTTITCLKRKRQLKSSAITSKRTTPQPTKGETATIFVWNRICDQTWNPRFCTRNGIRQIRAPTLE